MQSKCKNPLQSCAHPMEGLYQLVPDTTFSWGHGSRQILQHHRLCSKHAVGYSIGSSYINTFVCSLSARFLLVYLDRQNHQNHQSQHAAASYLEPHWNLDWIVCQQGRHSSTFLEDCMMTSRSACFDRQSLHTSLPPGIHRYAA